MLSPYVWKSSSKLFQIYRTFSGFTVQVHMCTASALTPTHGLLVGENRKRFRLNHTTTTSRQTPPLDGFYNSASCFGTVIALTHCLKELPSGFLYPILSIIHIPKNRGKERLTGCLFWRFCTFLSASCVWWILCERVKSERGKENPTHTRSN